MNPDNYDFTYNSEYDGTQSVFDGSTTTAAAVPYAHTSTSTEHFNAAYAFSSLNTYLKSLRAATCSEWFERYNSPNRI